MVLLSCKESPNEFTLGKKYIESQSSLSLIDTFSVDISTVIMDSLATSSTGRILVGNYTDDTFGKVECRSFFQIGKPDSVYFSVVKDDDIYDSLSLVIEYDNYFFGDTTKSQKIAVHQLTENLKYNDNYYISNRRTFNYNPQPIGSIIYSPRPNNPVDTLVIKIDDEVGRDLFMKLKNHSDILLDEETFINYFHGLLLVPGESYNGSIIGFKASSAKLILHTTRNEISDEEFDYEFLADTTLQFNNVSHDFSSSKLNGLVEQKNKLSSIKSGGLSFLQGAVGLAIRVDFPSLEDILLRERGTITKAQLSIQPMKDSYKDFALPFELDIYISDKSNEMVGTLSYPVSTLKVDELYHEETAYTFDITDYITGELSDSYVEPGNGLLILLPDDDLYSTLKRLVIEAKNSKLKIYYLSY